MSIHQYKWLNFVKDLNTLKYFKIGKFDFWKINNLIEFFNEHKNFRIKGKKLQKEFQINDMQKFRKYIQFIRFYHYKIFPKSKYFLIANNEGYIFSDNQKDIKKFYETNHIVIKRKLQIHLNIIDAINFDK